jgi:hypothetical protein
MRAMMLFGCAAAACASLSAVAEENFASAQQQILPGIRMVGPGDAGNCVQVGQEILFDVFVDNPQMTVVAGQFGVIFDNTVLEFVAVLPGAAPFVSVPLSVPNQAAGTLFWVSSVAGGGVGTAADSRIATLKFRTLREDCNDDSQLAFNTVQPPLLLTNGNGFGGTLPVTNPASTSVDSTPPVFSGVPANLDIAADAGAGCLAVRTLTEPTATDTCGPVTQSWTRSDGALVLNAPWPCGTTTVTWSAVNRCGLTSTATTTVTVNPYHLLNLAVEYKGPSATYAPSMTRCIGFRVGSFNFTQVLTFNYGTATGVAQIPVNSYNCATVDDDLHTLVSQTDVVIAGYNYALSATGADALVNGDLNDDNLINVIDWGIVVIRIGTSAAVDTDCMTDGFQCDFNGNGLVTDFDGNYVLDSFLARGDNGCGLPPTMLAQNVTRISVKELSAIVGADASAADLNRDGVVDQRDMSMWKSGKRVSKNVK